MTVKPGDVVFPLHAGMLVSGPPAATGNIFMRADLPLVVVLVDEHGVTVLDPRTGERGTGSAEWFRVEP